MTTVANKPTSAIDIKPVLDSLRWRIRGYVVLQGLAWATTWLGIAFWFSLAIDYLPVLAGASETPWAIRLLLLLFTGAVFSWIIIWWILRRSTVRLEDRSMALLLERRYSGFQDSLLTAVEMRQHPDHALKFHPEMLDHARQKARAHIEGIRLHEVFRGGPLFRSVVSALLIIASIASFGFLAKDVSARAARRIYLLSDESWPRHAHIEIAGFQEGRVKVARGGNFPIRVSADAYKHVPDVCTIYYRCDDGQHGRVHMRKKGLPRSGQQQYVFNDKPFAGILSTVVFDVRGYDHRLYDYVIEVVDSPIVADVQLDCTFPEYIVDEKLGLFLPRTIPLTPGLQLPRGTQIRIRARSNKELVGIDILDHQTGSTLNLDTASVGDASRDFQHEIPSLDDSVQLEITLHDTDGVYSDQPFRIAITALADRPPQVDMHLHGIGTSITPDARLPVMGDITDDYGVARAWFDVAKAGNPSREFPFSINSRDAQTDILDIREQRQHPTDPIELQPGDQMLLTIKAVDNYNLDDVPHIGLSDTFELSVVTPEDLLSQLESRELELRRRFEQIIEEMTATRDSLVRVRSEVGQDSSSNGLRDPEDTSNETGDNNTPNDEEVVSPVTERSRSLHVLRVQRGIQEIERSAREVYAVGVSFDDICEELINNRVDSHERIMRLKEQIADPLKLVADSQYPQLVLLLKQLESSLGESDQSVAVAGQSVEKADQILLELDKVLQRMLDLETFNELVDMIRSLIKEQDQLLDETKTQKRKQARELLD